MSAPGMLLVCLNRDILAHSMSLAFLNGEVLAHGLGGLGLTLSVLLACLNAKDLSPC